MQLEQLQAVFEAARDEPAPALQRAFECHVEIKPPEAWTRDGDEQAKWLEGPGLCLAFTSDQGACLLLIPEALSWLPAWYREPEAKQQAQLKTLAQELGTILLPEGGGYDGFDTFAVSSMEHAIEQFAIEKGAVCAGYPVAQDGQAGHLVLIGPGKGIDRIERLAPRPGTASAPGAGSVDVRPEAPGGGRERLIGIQSLPDYARSLMRVEVPVVVSLARTRQPVKQILDIGLGTIIQFDKSCEEALSLEVGNHSIAVGEAVKVGDKFGLRITRITLPPERFHSVRPKQAGRQTGARP